LALLLRLLLVAVAAYAAVCLLVYLFQARLVFFPGPAPRTTPAELGLAGFERELTTADGEHLHAWFLPCVDAKDAVLVCHGNAGNVADRAELARAFLALGRAVLVFDYRGYGRSTGRPSEEGTYLDALAAHEHLVRVEGFAPEHIALYGESLGVAVALELALRVRTSAALIAESGFSSLADMGAEVYPFLPARWLARIRYDNAAKIPRLGVPLLLIHSPDDEIVPVAHARRLFAAAPEPKQLLLTAGGHNAGGFTQRGEWRAAVVAFLDSAEIGQH
jgi:fermentation-respiration switch protein FrsA (DUF1100 family)